MSTTRPHSLAPVQLAAILVLGSTGPSPAQSKDPTLPKPEEQVFQQDVAWSADGKWIAFSQYDGAEDYKPQHWSIHLVAVDGSQQRKLLDNAMFVTWSPDGRKLAFGSSRDGNWEIYSMHKDGNAPARLTRHEAKDSQPAWSPDGGRIAFCSDRDGSESIYVMSADGSDIKRLTDDPASDFNPAWSPDGKQIVFYRETGDHKDQIYVINADGSGERRITRGRLHNTFPSFLPDGRIAFTSMDAEKNMSFVCVGPAGENRTRVGRVSGHFARWSPDGKQVAFIAGRWPQSAVYVMSPDAASIRKLVN